jgi:beta-glucosidase
LFLSNEPYGVPVPGASYNGTVITGGGSGAVTPAFIDAPLDALQRKARDDRSIIFWDTNSFEPTVNAASDVCLVFVNEIAAEGWDRPNIVSTSNRYQHKDRVSQLTNPSTRPTQHPTTSSSTSPASARTPKS